MEFAVGLKKLHPVVVKHHHSIIVLHLHLLILKSKSLFRIKIDNLAFFRHKLNSFSIIKKDCKTSLEIKKEPMGLLKHHHTLMMKVSTVTRLQSDPAVVLLQYVDHRIALKLL
jgi:hypothetical protein